MKTKDKFLLILAGVLFGACAVIGVGALFNGTSTNDACLACHFHSAADDAWKQSSHFNNKSGTKADCAQCHLPEKGTFKYFKVKTKTGVKDLLSYIFKKSEDIDWESKGELDYAKTIVFNESCKSCHHNLYPEEISDDGVTAHLYYDENETKYGLQCINCHLDVGHFNPSKAHKKMAGVPVTGSSTKSSMVEKFKDIVESIRKMTGAAVPVDESSFLFSEPAVVDEFKDFVETIPGTSVYISMKAIPGGTFTIGSPDSEKFRSKDEGPQKSITVSPFFMAETELTWDQYWAFYGETMSEGRIDPEVVFEHNSRTDIDAVSGPTPPYGAPDQGWGMGERPAITMTHYAAETFCKWLSMKTGKTYRLPTEAEWEYAARGGSDEAYFFGGKPSKYSSKGFLKGIFKPDTTSINSYAVYALNSRGRTAEPSKVKANPFGLRNMYGNVAEYCSDWYSPDAYAGMSSVDPKGPSEGTEHVVRGGTYGDDASLLRSAARFSTHHDDWLRTDPQMPKSIWWYSDVKAIGFRVVCELTDNIKQR